MGKEYYDGHLVNYSSSNGYPTIWDGSKNILLHRYVWEKHFGPIPKGYHIHHVDKNKANYNIENLCLISASEHGRHHAIENRLGKQNKGKLKVHSSGFCSGAKGVIIFNDYEHYEFDSVTEAARFIGVKKASDVSRVLTGKRKTIKGWCCNYR